ncbi:PP2C family protein-serine/threonine phosphatase [Chondromyces apiculatus]|uniref:Protein phosphatase n=1 Tax=Chondromyces apiculatus DSM 436 TaxID=1192034 RepID=A0A017SUU7_9BACT|nr:protein phosphatase 2C domain-containing protein [Chondromyces apiculatus]EYF00773.1 protein phosphatase [Chondromyces apiculatus DSM 436]
MVYRDAPVGSSRLTFAARTDTGPLRTVNEDAFLVLALRDTSPFTSPPNEARHAGRIETSDGILLAVLDGLGGSRGGTEACRIAIEAIRRRVRAGIGTGQAAVRRTAIEAVEEANRAVWRASTTLISLTGIGATITAAAIAGRWVHLVHAGDTRAYLLRDGHLQQITRDDSLLNEARDHGVPFEEIQHIPSTVLTRALGMNADLTAADTSIELDQGDLLLLCSDGVYRFLSDAAMEALLRRHPEPSDGCEALVESAIRGHSSDNLTALLVRFTP